MSLSRGIRLTGKDTSKMGHFCKLVFVLTLSLKGYQVAAFHQSDYNLTSERMDLAEYNKNFFTAGQIKNFKYNRTHTAVNVSFATNQPLGKMRATIQAYRFASNEYRLFPLNFAVDICEVFEKDDFGLRNMFQCGNFRECPVLKASYLVCNWIPDESKFPPHMPDGRYQIDLKISHGTQQLSVVQWYLKIEKKFHYI